MMTMNRRRGVDPPLHITLCGSSPNCLYVDQSLTQYLLHFTMFVESVPVQNVLQARIKVDNHLLLV